MKKRPHLTTLVSAFKKLDALLDKRRERSRQLGIFGVGSRVGTRHSVAANAESLRRVLNATGSSLGTTMRDIAAHLAASSAARARH